MAGTKLESGLLTELFSTFQESESGEEHSALEVRGELPKMLNTQDSSSYLFISLSLSHSPEVWPQIWPIPLCQ